MLSKAQISLIRLLEQKKHRDSHKLFIAEGSKLVTDLLNYQWPIYKLFITNNLLRELPVGHFKHVEHVEVCNNNELKRISKMSSPAPVIAIAKQRTEELHIKDVSQGLVLAIDYIQDPGNFGNIIRICDWFGIEHLICSNGSTDVYNSKVVQASMGSFLRVKVHYVNLESFVEEYSKTTQHPVYGTFLEGENIWQVPKQKDALIIMGNEGKGISNKIEKLTNHKLFIPPYNPNASHIESLNISTATSIIVSAFRSGE